MEGGGRRLLVTVLLSLILLSQSPLPLDMSSPGFRFIEGEKRILINIKRGPTAHPTSERNRNRNSSSLE